MTPVHLWKAWCDDWKSPRSNTRLQSTRAGIRLAEQAESKNFTMIFSILKQKVDFFIFDVRLHPNDFGASKTPPKLVKTHFL